MGFGRIKTKVPLRCFGCDRFFHILFYPLVYSFKIKPHLGLSIGKKTYSFSAILFRTFVRLMILVALILYFNNNFGLPLETRN